jgi:hypothetical protein
MKNLYHAAGDTELDRNHPLFTNFLRHLVDEHDFSPLLVIQIVEKPWKWQPEFEKFLAGEEIEL